MKRIVWQTVALGVLSSVLVVTLASDRHGFLVSAYVAAMLLGIALARFIGWVLICATRLRIDLDLSGSFSLWEQVQKHRLRAFRALELLEWVYVTGCLLWSLYRLHSVMMMLWLLLGLAAAACAADAAAEIALNKRQSSITTSD